MDHPHGVYVYVLLLFFCCCCCRLLAGRRWLLLATEISRTKFEFQRFSSKITFSRNTTHFWRETDDSTTLPRVHLDSQILWSLLQASTSFDALIHWPPLLQSIVLLLLPVLLILKSITGHAYFSSCQSSPATNIPLNRRLRCRHRPVDSPSITSIAMPSFSTSLPPPTSTLPTPHRPRHHPSSH
jgi:hypothetical protein